MEDTREDGKEKNRMEVGHENGRKEGTMLGRKGKIKLLDNRNKNQSLEIDFFIFLENVKIRALLSDEPD